MADGAKLPPKWALKAMVKVNVFVYRRTGGRLMAKMKGAPICLVTMTGRKSGRKLTIPLMYTPDGENVLLGASLMGAAKHPVWYHNLVANPDIQIQLGSRTRDYRVHQADAAEKAKVWPLLVAGFPDFAEYQKVTDRDIPVMVCEPI